MIPSTLTGSSTTSDRLLKYHDRQTAIALLIISQSILVICSTASPVNERTSLNAQRESLAIGIPIAEQQLSPASQPDLDRQSATFFNQPSQVNQDGWLPPSRKYEPGLARPKINASPPQLSLSANNHNTPEPDLLREGSGDGPIQTARNHHSSKLDDTEDGDDDEDDYDYKDTLEIGSGNGNQTPEMKKTEQPVLEANNQLKRPNMSESDLYLPFRPPSNPQSIASTVARNNSRQATTEIPDTLSNITHELGQVKPSSPQTDTKPSLGDKLFDQTQDGRNLILSTSTTMAPRAIETNSYLMPSTPTFGSGHQPANLPEMNQAPSSPTNISPAKINNQEINNSSISRPRIPNNTDVDYEYEDEGDDDDSEDASNFEDNESPDAITSVSKPTISHAPNGTMTDIQEKTTSPQLMHTGSVLPTTSAPRAVTSSTNQMTLSSFLRPNHAQTVAQNTPGTLIPTGKPNLSIPTTKSPVSVGVSTEEVVTGDDDIDEEENDDEEEEDENDDAELDDDVEDDIEADDDNQSLGERPTSDIIHQTNSFVSTSTVKPQRNSKLPSMSTPLDPGIGQFTSQRGSHPNQSSSPTSKPNYPQIVEQPVVTVASVVTQSRAPTTPVSPISAETIPKAAVSTSTTIAPQSSVPPHISISTTVRTITPKSIHSTTPRPPSITRTSNIQTYSNLPNDDDDLTRQIYDKAVEVYQFANKAFNSALEVVLSPKLELNSSTFEPLLASSLLFMLTLGAAVIGLVLTMMLVVYIINNQMLPKDDISIY